MRSKAGILILLLLFFCHRSDARTLELKDVQFFKAVETEDHGQRQLHISGLAFHSALVVKKMITKKKGNDLIIELRLVFTRKGLSRRFDYSIPIASDTNRIPFGKEQKEIWKRT